MFKCEQAMPTFEHFCPVPGCPGEKTCTGQVRVSLFLHKEKNLLSNTDPFERESIYIISLLLIEEDGKIVPDPDSPVEGTVSVRLEGDRLVIGVSDENDNEKATTEYVWSKVNATDIVISDETKALAYEADWADTVSYNGVNYQKAEDEYGEYYRVVSVQDGADPEETINGLPVKER